MLVNCKKRTGGEIMRAYIVFSSGVLAYFLSVCGCRSSRVDQQTALSQTAIWQQQPLVIDGSDSDWVKPLPYYDRKEKLRYAVSNDRYNIYIILSTGNEQEQQKILQGGMTVWINSQAEKNDNTAVGIGFPTDNRKSRNRNIMAAARPDLYKDKATSLDDLKDYSLYGFKKEGIVENYDYGQSNEEGVEVKINFNHAGELVYEALVPLNAVFPRNSSLNFTRKSIAVGFFMEGLPPNAGMHRGDGGGGISIGGGIGMGSYGNGGGVGVSIGSGSLGRIGGRGGRHIYEQSRIWQVVFLARPSLH